MNKFYPEIIGSIVCLTLGMVSGYSIKMSDFIWYSNLIKPFFNPPAWVFGPVWTVIYLMMGVVFGILWKDKIKNRRLIFIFIAQLIFNLAWSPIFFYYQRINLALLDVCALWILLAMFMISARNQRPVFMLFLPYILWVTFAMILNVSIYRMNPMH